ncbi:hypothetical protein C8Q70DRAFT_935957 [Cubamyces menziesii]|nr:hypothetical protein C8Q70DRAFT_935957 [Cubamyces menziesii]
MSPQDPSDIILMYAGILTTEYCEAAATTLLVYYVLTTLDETVEYLRHKFNLASLLYLMNKTTSLIYAIYAGPIWPDYPTKAFCIIAETSIGAGLEFIQYIFWGSFSALRVYALQRNPCLIGFHWLQAYTPTEGCIEQELSPLWFQHR